MTDLRLRKTERLTLRNEIQRLFSEGKSLRGKYLKLVYSVEKDIQGTKIKVLFSVPKKKHKSAVKRNLMKRRMREAYRINKSMYLPEQYTQKLKISIGFIYLSPLIISYQDVEADISILFSRLLTRLSKKK